MPIIAAYTGLRWGELAGLRRCDVDLDRNLITVLRPELSNDIMSMPLREARETFEKQYLAAQINRFGGNISKTSNFVGMERSALHRKLKMLGIGNDDKQVA